MQWPKEKGQQIMYKTLHRKLNNTITTMTTGGPGENHRPVASHWQTLSHQFSV
jgi:hypothetical protein